jgi:energy-coupling factor transporter ATP-binding protein EcfA2
MSEFDFEFDDESTPKVKKPAKSKQKRVTVSTKTKEQLLLSIFGGNPYYSKAITREGNVHYIPEEGELTEKLLNKHINGDIVLGAYQINREANAVNWIAWDVDCENMRLAREYAQKLLKHLANLPYAIEFSGRKGYHIFLFLEEPMQASMAKQIAEHIRDLEKLPVSGINHVECFPKQDRLTGNKPKGNLLKIPLGKHPKINKWSVFVDTGGDWEEGEPANPLEVLRLRVKPEDVEALVAGEGVNPLESIAQLISPYWVSGIRHDLALYLCGFLANEGWTAEQASELVQIICELTGDSELPNRLQTVKTTFERYTDGKKIRGRQGLAETLPSNVMHDMTSLISVLAAPNTLREIDAIRFSKSRTGLEGARLASDVIWDILTDGDSEIVNVDGRIRYWFNSEDYSLQNCTGDRWDAMLNQQFGMNRVDGFSKMTLEELRNRLVYRSLEVPVYKFAHWDTETKRLYVNLGGSEVYIISGEGKIDVDYNGACGFFFETRVGEVTIPDFTVQDSSAFNYLIHDLSFTASQDCPATPEQQIELLKAWFLSYFFSELMPTRPILALIGAPGSGKTTAMRRFVRVLEDPDGDVLGVPTDKQDAFRSSVENHRLLVMDNMERSGVYWLVDMLNKLSTGANIELRQLFKTNETYSIKPNCFVALTAIKIPFSEETLFSRLLVLEMDQIAEPIPEYMMQRTIKEQLPQIWGSILYILSQVVEVLQKPLGMMRAPSSNRLADFSVFCHRLYSTNVVDEEILQQGILAMTNLQMHQLSQSSPAVVILQEWIDSHPEESGKWMNFGELYQTLMSTATVRNMKFPWKDSSALLRHLLAVKQLLERELRLEMTSGNGRFDPSQRFAMRDLKIRFNTYLVEDA